MTAFLTILRWELRYYLRRISTWVYFSIFAGIAFLLMLVLGGAFDEVSAALGGGGKVVVNAPYQLASLIPVLALLGVSVTAAIAGNALYKDYEWNTTPLFYTVPVSKASFLGGRFAGTLIINAIVM